MFSRDYNKPLAQTMTELVTKLEKRIGVTVGYKDTSTYDAIEHEGRVGKHGFDANLRLDKMIEIASRMENRPNIIVKAGVNAKWYLHLVPIDNIDADIDKQRWRDTVNSTMWIIEW
jgi:hypothetical protein